MVLHWEIGVGVGMALGEKKLGREREIQRGAGLDGGLTISF